MARIVFQIFHQCTTSSLCSVLLNILASYYHRHCDSWLNMGPHYLNSYCFRHIAAVAELINRLLDTVVRGMFALWHPLHFPDCGQQMAAESTSSIKYNWHIAEMQQSEWVTAFSTDQIRPFPNRGVSFLFRKKLGTVHSSTHNSVSLYVLSTVCTPPSSAQTIADSDFVV